MKARAAPTRTARPGTSQAARSKPSLLGLGEDLGAELGDELVLDLLLREALGDELADLLALVDRLGGVGGELEGRAADRAHHLVLDVGEGGLRLLARGGAVAADRRAR